MIFLCLGSNLGDRLSYLARARTLLSSKLKVAQVSSVYETSPVGGLGGAYLNQVVMVESSLDARELLNVCLSVEREMGRERSVRNAPRTIDIDVLLYDDRVIREKGLVIPHERMHLRRFVLVPLCEIAPEVAHPVLGKSVSKILADLEDDEKVDLYSS